MNYANNHPSIRKQFGKFLKEARVNAGFSQRHIAGKLGLKNGQYVSNFERGLCSPPLGVLKILVEKYGIHKKDLIKYFIDLEKHNLELEFCIVETPEIIKTPFLSI